MLRGQIMMKKFGKIFLVILVVMIMPMTLISCGGAKATPEESTKIFLDIILKDDKTNMNKIGVNKEDYLKLKKDQEADAMKCFGPSGLENSIVTDEIKNSLKEDILKGISKIDYEVTLESIDENTAKVNVKIKVFDMDKAIKEGEDKIKEKYLANPSMTQRDILQDYFKIVGEFMANGTVKEQMKTVKINLNKKGSAWRPEDEAQSNIMNAIIGR